MVSEIGVMKVKISLIRKKIFLFKIDKYFLKYICNDIIVEWFKMLNVKVFVLI